MTLLPIQFRTNIDTDKNTNLNKSDILDIIQNYFEEEGYNYISRKKNKVIFHKANLWQSLNFKSFLVSGTVKVIEKEDSYVIINGNWTSFLILIPFILIYLIMNSSVSAIQNSDIKVIEHAFKVLFFGNVIIRFLAHYKLRSKIREMLKNL